MTTIRIDTSQLGRLVADLTAASVQAKAKVRPVIQRGSLNIKTDARRRISGHKHSPAYPRSITYDTVDTPYGVEGLIGPDKSLPQGALGNILEFGTSKNAPIPHLVPAWLAEVPKTEAALLALVARFPQT